MLPDLPLILRIGDCPSIHATFYNLSGYLSINLFVMKKPNPTDDKKAGKTNEPKEGYPIYPKKDDIYSRAEEVKDIDPDDLSRIKPKGNQFELDPDEDLEIDGNLLDDDLDVPGSDLDDELEDIGSEDEENNYYSIGGDNHEDLEEDNQTYDLEDED